MCEIEYRVERKEYLLHNLREPGSPAESPGGVCVGKVRPGANQSKKLQMRVEPRLSPPLMPIVGVGGFFAADSHWCGGGREVVLHNPSVSFADSSLYTREPLRVRLKPEDCTAGRTAIDP